MKNLFPLNPLPHFRRQYELEKERVCPDAPRCRECGAIIDTGSFCDIACAYDNEQNVWEQFITGN